MTMDLRELVVPPPSVITVQGPPYRQPQVTQKVEQDSESLLPFAESSLRESTFPIGWAESGWG